MCRPCLFLSPSFTPRSTRHPAHLVCALERSARNKTCQRDFHTTVGRNKFDTDVTSTITTRVLRAFLEPHPYAMRVGCRSAISLSHTMQKSMVRHLKTIGPHVFHSATDATRWCMLGSRRRIAGTYSCSNLQREFWMRICFLEARRWQPYFRSSRIGGTSVASNGPGRATPIFLRCL